MQVKLLAATSLRLERRALAAEFQQATGRALRRTGVLPALALLACLRCIAREDWANDPARTRLPTLLLWHTRSVIAEEASALIRMMLEAQEALMPYDFLGSQPALMGVGLQTYLPELSQAICLPWVDEAGTQSWQRSLLLAAHSLQDKSDQRVICLQLDRNAADLQAHTLSLTLAATGPRALATLEVGMAAASLPAQDFVPRLSHWLDAAGPAELPMDGGVLALRAR